jgi:hypothetical protein
VDAAHLPLFAALAALVLGLGIFAVLLLLGLVVIRRLRLPRDPPEKIHFELPPPALRDAADKAGAPAVAAMRQALGARLALARTVVDHGLACHEILAALADDPLSQDPAHAQTLAELRHAGGIAVTAAEEAERVAERLRTTTVATPVDDGLESLAQRAAEARRQVDAAVARLPGSSGNRRLWLLLGLLVLMMAGLAALRWLPTGP